MRQEDLRQENDKLWWAKIMKQGSDGSTVLPRRVAALMILLLVVSSSGLRADNVTDRLSRTNLLSITIAKDGSQQSKANTIGKSAVLKS